MCVAAQRRIEVALPALRHAGGEQSVPASASGSPCAARPGTRAPPCASRRRPHDLRGLALGWARCSVGHVPDSENYADFGTKWISNKKMKRSKKRAADGGPRVVDPNADPALNVEKVAKYSGFALGFLSMQCTI